MASNYRGLASWNFDVTSVDKTHLSLLCRELFNLFSFAWDPCFLDGNTLEKLVELTSSLYAPPGSSRVPYHNWLHAVDVLQATVVILQETGIDARLSDVQVAALLLSALFHDLGHPGVSNRQICNTHGNLFWIFGKDSPLELSHAHAAMHILSRFKAPPELKNLVYQLIMSTDSDKHAHECFDGTEDAAKGITDNRALDPRDRVKKSPTPSENPPPTDVEDNLALMRLILCCADVSNVARPLQVRSFWAHAWGLESRKPPTIERQRSFVSHVEWKFVLLKDRLPASSFLWDALQQSKTLPFQTKTSSTSE